MYKRQAQTNITSVGTLSSLTVSGALNATLTTAAQTNITSVGTLTSLTVGGNTTSMAWYANQGVIQIGPQMTFHSETTSTTSQSGHMSLNAQLDTDGSWEYILSSNKASNYYQYQGTHNWRVAAAGTAGNDITWTTAMSLDNDGNVGIGNTSPSSYYSTFDNLVIGTTGANGITIVSSTNQVGTVAFADGTSGNETYRGFVQYNHSADELYLGTSGATQLTMDDDGNVGIGASSPNVNLEIMGSDSYDAKMRFAYGTGSANSYACLLYTSPSPRDS